MRILLILLVVLTGCSGPPAGLGGPQHVTPPSALDDSGVGVPGLPGGNGTFSPNDQPTTQGGRYYGYD